MIDFETEPRISYLDPKYLPPNFTLPYCIEKWIVLKENHVISYINKQYQMTIPLDKELWAFNECWERRISLSQGRAFLLAIKDNMVIPETAYRQTTKTYSQKNVVFMFMYINPIVYVHIYVFVYVFVCMCNKNNHSKIIYLRVGRG